MFIRETTNFHIMYSLWGSCEFLKSGSSALAFVPRTWRSQFINIDEAEVSWERRNDGRDQSSYLQIRRTALNILAKFGTNKNQTRKTTYFLCRSIPFSRSLFDRLTYIIKEVRNRANSKNAFYHSVQNVLRFCPLLKTSDDYGRGICSEFESRKCQDFYFLCSVQTVSGGHPAFFGGWVKATRARRWPRISS
jgi:hypothetical protein